MVKITITQFVIRIELWCYARGIYQLEEIYIPFLKRVPGIEIFEHTLKP